MQRYGADVAGGAEALARRTARALHDAGDQVTVYTTTARDYLTWAHHLPEGVSDDGGVEVRRYRAVTPDPATAAALVRHLALSPGHPGQEAAWALAQGPCAPRLLADLERDATGFDAVVFWTYLYATTQLGIARVPGPSVLVPLAHDEPMLRFTLSRGVTRMADGLVFMTPEEALLVDDMHGIGDRPFRIIGTGLDPAPPPAPEPPGPGHVLYLGRVDPAKGVLDLVDAHARYRALGGTLPLVLAGRPTVPLSLPAWVRTTGFVDDAERDRLIAGARVVALPSRYESLSLAALEAWRAGRPTLTTSACEVVVGQTRRSGGGLWYGDAGSYADAVRRLEADPGLRARLGAAGRAFTDRLTWPLAVERWHALLAEVAARPAGAT